MSSTNDPTRCANCGQEKHTSELRRQMCQQEYLKALMKKWAITALIIAPTFLFLCGLAIVPAFAQEYESHLYVGVAGINQHEVVISQTQPSLSSVLAGSPIYFTIRLSDPETVSTIGLEQVVSQVEPNKVYGGYDIKTSAITNSENQTAIISLVDSEGKTSYSLVIQPEQKQIVTPEIQNPSLLPSGIGNYASYIVGTIIIGVILAIGISIVKHKSRQNSRWRTN